MRTIDLHVHSSCSDGTFAPAELVSIASQKNLSAFALTDHDTVRGLPDAIKAAEPLDIEVIPGIELSTAYHGKDIHILGLYMDYENSYFKNQLKFFQDSRDERNKKMITLLKEKNIDISFEQMKNSFGTAIWTRAHFARFLLDNGYIRSMNEAFDRYIGDHGPCFVPREKVAPAQAIRLLRDTAGIPILAHPLLYKLSPDALTLMTKELIAAGLLGIEAVYSGNTGNDEDRMKELAAKFNLKISGGSDFHGSNKPQISLGTGKGNLSIPYSILTDLKNCLSQSLII